LDPLSAAFTFSTVVGLIGQFRSERGATDQSDFNDFLVWLNKSNYQNLRASLEENRGALDAVRILLSEQHEALLGKLDSIDNALAAFASSYDGFRELSLAIKPVSQLSEGALSILAQFEESGASKILEGQTYDGPYLLYLDGQGSMEIPDKRFMEDDLGVLVGLGLLRRRYDDKGQNVYVFTRQASELIRRVNS